jgi:hypothetical protein
LLLFVSLGWVLDLYFVQALSGYFYGEVEIVLESVFVLLPIDAMRCCDHLFTLDFLFNFFLLSCATLIIFTFFRGGNGLRNQVLKVEDLGLSINFVIGIAVQGLGFQIVILFWDNTDGLLLNGNLASCVQSVS